MRKTILMFLAMSLFLSAPLLAAENQKVQTRNPSSSGYEYGTRGMGPGSGYRGRGPGMMGNNPRMNRGTRGYGSRMSPDPQGWRDMRPEQREQWRQMRPGLCRRLCRSGVRCAPGLCRRLCRFDRN